MVVTLSSFVVSDIHDWLENKLSGLERADDFVFLSENSN